MNPERETVLTVDDLPPLPSSAPSVREEMLKKLSDQQMEVIMTAHPPTGQNGVAAAAAEQKEEESKVDHMVRVNAAAGTGKTTTLLHLATRCIDLGHTSVRYLTFSNASADDAREHIQSTLAKEHKNFVVASTIHSCAYNLLRADSMEVVSQEPLPDKQFSNVIRDHCHKEIESYLKEAVQYMKAEEKAKENDDDVFDMLFEDDKEWLKSNATSESFDKKVKKLHDLTVVILRKTFQTFTMSKVSVEQFAQTTTFGRYWYPGESSKYIISFLYRYFPVCHLIIAS